VRLHTRNIKNEIIMNHTPIYISRDDYTKLRLLLATALYSNSNGALQKLREELDRAAIIDTTAFPADVVTMESTVEFEDLATSEIEEYTITFPDRADVERKRISILAPIGTALIGCRVGDIVKWTTPGGIRQLKVRRVALPTNSSGASAAAPAFSVAAATP
jgi:regulator of nucleoside diphosphate kinase